MVVLSPWCWMVIFLALDLRERRAAGLAIALALQQLALFAQPGFVGFLNAAR